jgi:hypothetical protein
MHLPEPIQLPNKLVSEVRVWFWMSDDCGWAVVTLSGSHDQ